MKTRSLAILILAIISTTFSLSVQEARCDRSEKTPFTIILLPDTQIYSQSFPDIFVSQTEWIRDNRDERNIAAVIHLGDITNNNMKTEWKKTSEALSIIEEKTPLFLVAGNHDMGQFGRCGTRDTEFFDTYYPPSKFDMKPWFGGVYAAGSIQNAYYFLEAGGMQFIIVCLEFGPRDEVLDWAGEVLSEHEDKKAIIVTHCYMYHDDTRVGEGDSYSPHEYSTGGNDGEEMWSKLISKHRNVSFVLSGHILGDGTGRQISKGDKGNKVHEILSNYQMKQSGGNGWLRIMYFVPKKNRVYVSTYSPYLDEYDESEENKFELKFKMR